MAQKKSKKLLLYGGIGVAILMIFLIIGKQSGFIGKDDSIKVETEKAGRNQIIEKVSASGKVQPVKEVKISPDVSGEIVELYVKEGDSVKIGQLLVRIRPDNYVSLLDQMVAVLNTQKAQMAQAKSRLAQAEAQNFRARQEYDRQKKLYDEKVISISDWEIASANMEVSKQDLISARENLEAARYNIQSAQARVNEARENLNRTSIYAPVTGIVSKQSVEQGERVVGTAQMTGTEMMRVADLSKMEVRVFVNENDVVRVKMGDTAEIDVDSYSSKNEKFKGVVTSIANTAKESMSLDAVTEFEVRVQILNESYIHLLKDSKSPSPFRPGMTASVDIITEKKPNALSVPLSSVTTRKTKDSKKKRDEFTGDEKDKVNEVVFVKDGSKAKMVEVKTGLSDFDNIEILNGVNEGDEVITGPFIVVSKLLKDGSTVGLKEKKAEKDKESEGGASVTVEVD